MMEDTTLNLFDDLELEQAEKLIADINVDINSRVKKRIKKAVFSKTKVKAGRLAFIPKKLVACLVVFALLLTSMSVVGFGNVAAAVGKMFSFIPGYGIIENNDSIKLILEKPVTAENGDAILTLENAIATDNSITVMFTLERKNYSDAQVMQDKLAQQAQLEKTNKLAQPNVSLLTKKSAYSSYLGSWSGGSSVDTSTLTYTIKPDEINKDTTYKLEYKEYQLAVDFKLKDYQTYSDLNQIGVTGYNNDISITAVPSFDGNQVAIRLYSINKSKFVIDAFDKINNGYNGKDLKLTTDSGSKPYTVPDGWGGVNMKFKFDIAPTDNNFTLNIPYIQVHSIEDKEISLPIPNVGKIININKQVVFRNSTMTIVSVENVAGGSDNSSLKMTLKYNNKSGNIVMHGAQFQRVNFWGISQSGGYSATMDQNDIVSTLYFDLNKGETGSLRLKVSNPQYYLTNPYTLKFERK